MARTDPWQPDLARTVNAVGDQHHGNLTTARRTLYEKGLARPMMRRDEVAAHLFLGDLSNTGTPGDDALYLAHAQNHYGAAPVVPVLGNHDVYQNVRSPEAAAAALGLPARNYTVDLGFVVIVVVFPGDEYTAFNSGSQFSTGALTWLDATLASLANRQVWIACHFPIYDTVAGLAADPAVFKRSVTSGYYVAVNGVNHANSDEILQLLAAHPCVRAWISGHTHSSLAAPGLLTTIQVGARRIPHINASSVAPTDQLASQLSQINTMFLTATDTGVEVRIRAHHGGGFWNSLDGSRVIRLEAS